MSEEECKDTRVVEVDVVSRVQVDAAQSFLRAVKTDKNSNIRDHNIFKLVLHAFFASLFELWWTSDVSDAQLKSTFSQ